MNVLLEQSNSTLLDTIRNKYKKNPIEICQYVRANYPQNAVLRHYQDDNLFILSNEVWTLRASHTNKLYQTTKKNWQIFLNREKKTAYYKTPGILRQLVKELLFPYNQNVFNIVTKFMGDKFEWLNNFPIEHSIGFIWKRGYSSPYNYYKENDILWYKQGEKIELTYIHDKKNVKRVSKNWGYLKQNPRLWNTIPDIVDIVKFAIILQEKINWNWSEKRFEQMHNEWYQRVNALDTLFDIELSVNPLFEELNIPDLVLLKTNNELKREGQRQHHCVYTYKSNIDRGEIGIFVYQNDWTCEINNRLELIQMKGKNNSTPSSKVRTELMIQLDIEKNRRQITNVKDEYWFQSEPQLINA